MSKKVILSLIAVALVLVGYLLFSKQNQPTPVAPEVKTQVQPEVKYPQHIEAITGTDEVWYSIPEFEVRMRLNKEFAEDLVYKLKHEKNDDGEEWDAISFSTKGIMAVALECAPENDGVFGVFTRIDGTVEEADKNNLGLGPGYFQSRLKTGTIVQFPQYFVIWTSPQAPCWPLSDNEAVESERSREYAGSGAKGIYDGVKTLQLIPSK